MMCNQIQEFLISLEILKKYLKSFAEKEYENHSNKFNIIKFKNPQEEESNETESNDIDEELIGKYVIVRTYSAGVHFGLLHKKIESEILLKDARRIWSWENRFTLSKIITDGLDEKARLSTTIPIIWLIPIEIMPCTEKCIESLLDLPEHNPCS